MQGRQRHGPQVPDWFDAAPPDTPFVSVLTLGGIRKELERLGNSSRHARRAAWFENELLAWFENRILPVDMGVAGEWDRLLARAGNIPVIDGLFAAHSLRRRLRVVTSNEANFAATGVDMLHPQKD